MAEGAVQQHLHPVEARDRDGVGVDGDDGHEVLGLRARMVHHPPAAQQHQRVARAQRPKVDRGYVSPRAAFTPPTVLEVTLALLVKPTSPSWGIERKRSSPRGRPPSRVDLVASDHGLTAQRLGRSGCRRSAS